MKLLACLLIPFGLVASGIQVPAPPGTDITSTISGETDGINWIAGWGPFQPPNDDRGGYYFMGFDQPISSITISVTFRDGAPDNGADFIPIGTGLTPTWTPDGKSGKVGVAYGSPGVSSLMFRLLYSSPTNYAPVIRVDSLTPAAVAPEPNSVALFSLGAIGLLLFVKRGRRLA